MKSLFKLGGVLALGMLLHVAPAEAQVRVNVHAPAWGPRVPRDVQYYYIPEIDGYYDLYSGMYLFYDPNFGDWVSSPVLPRYYASYDPRYFHPVVIEYIGRRPWGYLPQHRAYCDRWGVRPGRYYGVRWPGRGYGAYPRGNYAAYAGRGSYNHPDYDDHDHDYDERRGNDSRWGYGNRRDDNRGRYDNRRDDDRRGSNRYGDIEDWQDDRRPDGQGGRSRDDRRRDDYRPGASGSQDRGGYSQPSPAPAYPNPAGQPGGAGRGRGRGRLPQ